MKPLCPIAKNTQGDHLHMLGLLCELPVLDASLLLIGDRSAGILDEILYTNNPL